MLYFTTTNGNDMELYAVDLDGGAGDKTLLGSMVVDAGFSYWASNVVANATHVYWTSASTALLNASIAEIQLDGGDQTVLATGNVDPNAPVLDAQNLYWLDVGYPDGGSVWKLPLAGGPAIELASSPTTPVFLAVDATSLYWTAEGVGVQRMGLDGGPVTALTSVAYAPGGLAVDAGNLYFSFGTDIEALSLATGSIAVVATIQASPAGLILDGTTLYWIAPTQSTGVGTVMKLPLGCPAPIQLAGNQELAGAPPPVVDATSIYWAVGGVTPQILKLPK